jgi:branched-chain amino acid transport system ATP-binding protein
MSDLATRDYADPAFRAKLVSEVDRSPGAAKPDSILVVDNVVRHFGGMTAVDVDHLEVQRGIITALIGPNGAGKTTFFNLVTGFDKPGAGAHWSFDGQTLDKTSASSVAQAGMVRTFQLTKALNRMTVMDNMMLGATEQSGENLLKSVFKPLWQAREREIEEQAEDLLDRFKLLAKKDDYAGSLSGGQRKLLEMARALMSRPKMIMLDEPMAGVNPALTQSLLGHIQSLRDEGTTVLFVEHDMHMVRHISDWVVVMAEGRVIAEGPADTVMSDQAVIDAYLGAHHDVDLGDDSLLEEDAVKEMAAEVAREDAAEVAREDAAGAGRRGGEQMSGQPVVEATDIVAGYLPGVNILDGCNLVAYPGEMIGIIGPNGAGKSTLLKAMFGLVKVHSGQVTLNGQDITNKKANRLVEMGVGFVPQTENVFPSLTIQENLQMGLYMRPKKITERLKAMWDLFPVLADRRNQRAGSLSGGERQSLAMARALMMEPTVLLLDEPSAGLSPVRQDETFIRTRRINKTGVCVVMVEQNARRCLQIVDRGYVLDQGRDAHAGTGRELANDPKVIELYLGTLAEDVDSKRQDG